MLDPVVTIDDHGKILEANESCQRVFGYEPSELIGENVRILMAEPHRSAHDGYLAKYRKTGETTILGRLREFPAVCKDGRRIEIELSVSRIEIPGESAVYCGSFRDITDRKEADRALRESERRFRAIFDGEFQLVSLLDPEGSVLEINRSLGRTDADRERVVGRAFWELDGWFPEQERVRLRDAVRAAARSEFVRFEIQMQGAGGQPLDVDFSVKPILDEEEKVELLIVEGRDITELKAAQRRETAMTRAFAQIGESASLLAHEIKNPITSVNLALRAVAKHLGEDEQVVLAELVERMQRLEKLMRRTLSLTRPLDLGIVECTPDRIIADVEVLMLPHLESAGIRLESEVAADCDSFAADPDLLEDVLTNLVRNAADAMQGGGRIALSFAREGNDVLMQVDDDGPGIPERIRETLFRPFVSTKSGGTGLGLALARKIVEAHGGTIEAHQSPLGGARFEIRLPA